MIPAVETLDTIDSTNAEAKRRALAGKLGPLWLRAESQTGGVGRNGRPWHSPAGNLYVTYLTPFAEEVADAALMSFVACLAVADTLDRFVLPSRVSLKWPNDALLDEKKIAGVLLESGTTNGTRWLAIGIGINLAHKPEEARWPPISLSEVVDTPPTPAQSAQTLAEAFAQRETTFQAHGFAPIREAWLSRAARRGETIEARLPKEIQTGVFKGLDEDGALLLGTATGEIRISAADIHFPA